MAHNDSQTQTVNGLTFEQWYEKLDSACIRTCGLGIDDLPDGNSWDAWSDGMSPKEYLMEKLEEEGFPME